jgi:hypothetical protein
MLYTSRTIATDQVCLAISAKWIQHFAQNQNLFITFYDILNTDFMFVILKQLNAAII